MYTGRDSTIHVVIAESMASVSAVELVSGTSISTHVSAEMGRLIWEYSLYWSGRLVRWCTSASLCCRLERGDPTRWITGRRSATAPAMPLWLGKNRKADPPKGTELAYAKGRDADGEAALDTRVAVSCVRLLSEENTDHLQLQARSHCRPTGSRGHAQSSRASRAGSRLGLQRPGISGAQDHSAPA